MKKDTMEQFDRFFSELKNGYHYNPLISNESGRADTSNKSESKLQNTDTTTVDAVVVFALKDPERKMFQKACASSFVNDIKNGVVFQILDIKGEKRSIRIALATQREMGMVSAAIISTIALMTYRPKVIVMGGICAGVEGKVNIGDIIVANPTFNHEAGKKTERGFEAFFTQRNLTRNINDLCQTMAEDDDFLREIRDSWDLSTGKPATELSAHVVPMGSGSSVITETKTIESIAIHNRKITGLDMEAFAVAQSAYETLGNETPWLVVKGVQDFANPDKNDESREYAAFVSAKFIIEFLKRYFNP
jgi:nucleoside phosphorylase